MDKTDFPTDSELIFVYGTLRSGFDNPWALFLRRHAVYKGVGKMAGRVFDLGEYPGAVFEEEAKTSVLGEVFEILDKKLVLSRLDEYEGIGDAFPQPQEYTREVCPVWMEKSKVFCWVYLYNL